MQICNARPVDHLTCCIVGILGLGREAGNNVSAKHDIRPPPACLVAKADDITRQMTTLHLL